MDTPNELHYNAAKDPMKISNLDHYCAAKEPRISSNLCQHVLFLLESTRNDVPFKKVMVFMWESSRNDVLPFKKIPDMLRKFKDANPDMKITGDYDDGFKNMMQDTQYGGAHFEQRLHHTYTLKSVGTHLCNPLIAGTSTYKRHIGTSPGLPHIFDAMNKADRRESCQPWKSYFFDAMIHYDNQKAAKWLPAVILTENTQDDSLRSENAARDRGSSRGLHARCFVDAKENNGRVFLTHPHQHDMRDAYGIPKENNCHGSGKDIMSMSHYANARAMNDKWIGIGSGKMLDEVLHYANAESSHRKFLGTVLKLVENQGLPYYNPSVILGDHGVPLVFSHPSLPAFNHAVHSTQVPLVSYDPSLLDLMLEHAAHSTQVRQPKAAESLVSGNYEGVNPSFAEMQMVNNQGQALNGTIQIVNNRPSHAQRHFDVRYPDRHMLSVPLIDNTEWRLSDPRIDKRACRLCYLSFDSVEEEWAQWVEEGAFMDSVQEKWGVALAL
ncbi:hypothetical protein CEK25_013594 [Fusarium fujikuroi]|nr:hypothetical protein CEK25_013594 [Fusarium fujikuroi]